jgi:uncharacterized membrane protein YgcG
MKIIPLVAAVLGLAPLQMVGSTATHAVECSVTAYPCPETFEIEPVEQSVAVAPTPTPPSLPGDPSNPSGSDSGASSGGQGGGGGDGGGGAD